MDFAAMLKAERARARGGDKAAATSTAPVCAPVEIPTIALNDGRSIPTIGLGVYQSRPGEETYKAVSHALKIGYRHIDTAAIYNNEADVGRAVADSGIPREQIWITTKLWTRGLDASAAYNAALAAGNESAAKLGTYIDLFLLHSPHQPSARLDFWRAMQELQRLGVAKSIGVSNFGVHHLRELAERALATPAVNQIELHPFLRQDAIEAACAEKGIVVQAYSPLAKAQRLGHPAVKAVAARLGVSAARVLVRWSVQRGYVALPKSVTPARIAENADVFGFVLSTEDMQVLDGLDEHFTTGWDPTTGP